MPNAITKIADLWTPDLWIEGVNEGMNNGLSIINSGIVTKSDQLNQIASGAGVNVNIPFFKDATEQNDEVQAEDTEPTTQKLGTGKLVATVLNRVTANNATALASQVSGADPVAYLTGILGTRRLKQRQ